MRRAGLSRSFVAGAVVVVVVASALGALVATGPLAKSNSTSATTTSTSIAEAQGAVTILVSRTTLDQTPADSPSGYALYIYDLALTDNSSATELVGPSYFTLIGEAGAAYNSTTASSVQDALVNATSLSPTSETSGEVAFSVPDSDQPLKLEYTNPQKGFQETVSDLPAPSRWVSNVAQVQASLPTNADASNYFVSATLLDSGGLYYSGVPIPVKVEITPYNSDDIVDEPVPDITVTSISVSNQGFSISTISPTLPVTVSANGNTAATDILVYVEPPNASVSVASLSISLSTG